MVNIEFVPRQKINISIYMPVSLIVLIDKNLDSLKSTTRSDFIRKASILMLEKSGVNVPSYVKNWNDLPPVMPDSQVRQITNEIKKFMSTRRRKKWQNQ